MVRADAGGEADGLAAAQHRLVQRPEVRRHEEAPDAPDEGAELLRRLFVDEHDVDVVVAEQVHGGDAGAGGSEDAHAAEGEAGG